jgi:hypothetical protein
VYGLITEDEFGDRVGQALTSRIRAELALITADLPAGLAPAPALLGPARVGLPARAGIRPGDRAVGAALVLSALAFIAAFFSPPALADLLSLGAAGSALVSLFLAAAHVLSSSHANHSGGQLPPRGAIGPARSTGQLPQASQARWRTDAAPSPSLRAQPST